MAKSDKSAARAGKWLAAVVVGVAVGFSVVFGYLDVGAPPSTADGPAATPARLVSLAPSLTEAVFAIGAGDKLVGVTKQCRFPDAARDLPKIGDYMGPNDEALLLARPDLVLLLEEHAPVFPRLDALGLRYRVFDHRSLAGLESSFDELGAILERPEAARALRDELDGVRARLAREQAARPTRPRVLLVLGRDYAADRPRRVYAVGAGNLYSELLHDAGGENAYSGATAYPQLEEEGLLALRPEAIVELLGMDPGMPDAAAARAVWNSVPGLMESTGGRVRIIVGDAAFVPGPRTAGFLTELAKAIHN